ncbi:MAG: hypothetical protein JXA06_09245 [Bacteroidetes bacterium]|nr:hypothetical protein [Bacteroidota bacterium]
MKKTSSKFIKNWIIAIVIILCTACGSAFSQVKDGWKNLKYSIFFTHGDLINLLSDDAKFKQTMSYFAPIKIEKAYLEGSNRGDEKIQLMREISARFHAMNIKTVGAMVPVSETGPMCYNNPEHLALLEKRMKSLASIFDEIILDDWLFTICTCEKCIKGRGDASWADYRTNLLVEKSKKHIIDPAKKINPRVNVIIKYPNWYEGHRQNGYDVHKETLLYDKMAVGIETRISEIQDQHIPVYSGYVFQKWWTSVAPSKWIGSWLDNYGMKGGARYYNAQLWQAIMAQTPEIILWCGGQLYHTNPSSDVYPDFMKMLLEFDKAAGLLEGSSRGVPMYLPYGSTGEYNIFGYLGMIGIPIEPAAEFPAKSQNAIFTLHSLQDTGLSEKMLQRLKDGKDVFMTWDLYKRLGKSEFKKVLSLLPSVCYVTSSDIRIREGWSDTIIHIDKPMTFPRIETTTWPYVRDVAVVEEDYDPAVFLRTNYLNGTIYILNVPSNKHDLQRLPAEALTFIRRAFTKELGFGLIGPGNVACYLFGQKQYVLFNMGTAEAPVTLQFMEKSATGGWREVLHNKKITVREDTTFARFNGSVIKNISLTLKPQEVAIIEAP